MYISICDDNYLESEELVRLLNNYFLNKSFNYEIDCYESGKSLLYEYQDGSPLELIFLDMYLGDGMGIEVAKKLRKMGYKGNIVFITGTSDFAVEGYDVGAVGYLLKPCDYNKLSTVMDRVLKDYNADFYSIRQRNSVVRLELNSILYVESVNSKCILHSDSGDDFVIYKRLSDIENELNDARFLRCHQSYLVNMNYIQKADKNFELTNGHTVCIRQRELKNIKERYFQYINKNTLN